jgi:hypothetical protein
VSLFNKEAGGTRGGRTAGFLLREILTFHKEAFQKIDGKLKRKHKK